MARKIPTLPIQGERNRGLGHKVSLNQEIEHESSTQPASATRARARRVRDIFCNAIEAYLNWWSGESEPTVEFEVDYEPQPIPISRACTLVWNFNDVLPGALVDALRDDVEMRSSSYAAVAPRYARGDPVAVDDVTLHGGAAHIRWAAPSFRIRPRALARTGRRRHGLNFFT
jgi:hypothetical protein